MIAPKYLVPLVVAAVALTAVVLLIWQSPASTVPTRIGIPRNGRDERPEEEWRSKLTAQQFHVARRKGTERAFSGAYWDTKSDGVYHCVCCGQALFDSATKFDSGTGWPSYWEPIDENNVSLIEDNGWLAKRTEVICSRCDAHLGHVFPDGPKPTGLRYCMNSAALVLKPREKE